jgi:anti-sigma B factor antagonist
MVNVEVSTRTYGGYTVVALCGELDITAAPDVALAIAALTARGRIVIVDVSALDFMDCSSLGALLRVRRIARQGGGDVRLAGPLASVQRLLTLTGAGEVFCVHVSVEAAVASFGGSPQRFAVQRPAANAFSRGAVPLLAEPRVTVAAVPAASAHFRSAPAHWIAREDVAFAGTSDDG